MASIFLPISIGFLFWSIAFISLYGMHATGCQLGWDQIGVIGSLSLLRLVLISVFLLSASLVALLFMRFPRAAIRNATEVVEPARFAAYVTRYTSMAAFVAILFCFASVFWLRLC